MALLDRIFNRGGDSAPQADPDAEARAIQQALDSQLDLNTEVGVRADSILGVYQNHFELLSRNIDDIDERLSPDIKEKMMLDAVINSTIFWLVDAAMDRDIEYTPYVQDKADPDYDKAIKMYDYSMYAMEGIAEDFRPALIDQAVHCLVNGSSIAEKVMPIMTTGPYAGKREFGSYKVRHPDTVGFFVDRHMNILGIAANTGLAADPYANVPSLRVGDGKPTEFIMANGTSLPQGWKIFDPRKFSWLTNRPQYGDPRGQSILRHIYNEWYLIQGLWPQYLKYLLKFASPSIDFMLEEGAIPQRGGVDPLDAAMERLKNFQNSSIFARRAGSELQLMYSQGEGQAFIAAFSVLERRIVRGLTNQVLASAEARNMARAASETHQDTRNIVVDSIKRSIADMHRKHNLKVLIADAYGEEMARFAPVPSVGGVAPEDQAEMLDIVSGAWQRGYLNKSQLRAMDARMGLPYREVSEPGFYPAGAMNEAGLESAERQADAAEKTANQPKPAAAPASSKPTAKK